MKILLTALAVSLCCMYGCSQVPEVVKSKFAKMYPNSGNAKWEMEDGLYEGMFNENNLETAVIFSRDGNLIQTENEMDVNALPQSIKDHVASKLGGKKITSAAKIIRADGTMSFEAEVNKVDYVFDGNGKIIQQEEDEDGEEDD